MVKYAWNDLSKLQLFKDIPDADMKLPENILFVCKLNPCTTETDLELIFGRFGSLRSCEVVRDWKSGDSLGYSFIEFETDKACEEGIYFNFSLLENGKCSNRWKKNSCRFFLKCK